ncbi:MAG: hypothetical protein LDL47_01425 [Cyanobacteria bacterium KgW148]|nr:hypothetical protein [Cyanobacteria bacterium KgW148]
MSVEDALLIVDAVLQQKRLSNVQELLFRQAWDGKTYIEIAESSGYDASYIRDVGYKLWQSLTKALGERVSKNNLQVVFRRQLARCTTPNRSGAATALSPVVPEMRFVPPPQDGRYIDWGKAPDTSLFFGRTRELEELEQWLRDSQLRLIGIFGIGGIGKTLFTIKLAEQVQNDFTYVIWRSLSHAPAPEELLLDLLYFFNQGQEVTGSLDSLLSLLMAHLRRHRCLIILDGVEAVMAGQKTTGDYLSGYEGFGEIFRQIGEVKHQSCLLLNGREKPDQLSPLEGDTVRSMQLQGLDEEALNAFAKGLSDPIAAKELMEFYGGNPMALKIVFRSIQELFDGNISEFLAQNTPVFSSIRHLLDQQFNRLSDVERQIMFWLAINQTTVSHKQLQSDISANGSATGLLEALYSLKWRSLIEKRSEGFALQPVVMMYVLDHLVNEAFLAITSGDLEFLSNYLLLRPSSSPPVRERQVRFIMYPLVSRLINNFANRDLLIAHVNSLLSSNDQGLSNYCLMNLRLLLQQLQMEPSTNKNDNGMSPLRVALS